MLTLLDGLPGSGKSYTAVNRFVLDALLHESGRPIVVNLPIRREALLDEAVRQTAGTRRSPATARRVRAEYDARLIELQGGLDVVRDGESYDPAPDQAAWLIDWECQHVEERVLDGLEWRINWKFSGRPKPGPLIKDRITEFWYFTPPNSFVVFDEAADQYNNKLRNQNARTTLGEYIRQHRHFKDDLLFITQCYEDLDKQFREKFEVIYRVSNSLKENMFATKWLQGLKWPLQFFILRQFLRRGNKLILENTLRILPKKSGYALYESFSKPKHQFGKASLRGDEKSSDYQPPLWYRLRDFASRARDLILLGFAALVAIIMIGRMMWKMLHLTSDDVAQGLDMETKASASSPENATKAGESASTAITTTTPSKNEKGADDKQAIPEKPQIVGIVDQWVYYSAGASRPISALRGDDLADVLAFLGVWARRDADGLAILWATGGSGAGELPAAAGAKGERPDAR